MARLLNAPPRRPKIPHAVKKQQKRAELAEKLKQLLGEIDREGFRLSAAEKVGTGAVHAFLHARHLDPFKRGADVIALGSVGMGDISIGGI